MASVADVRPAGIPSHVPEALVAPFTLSLGSEALDPFEVLIPRMQAERPDIFYAPGAHMTGAGAWVPKRADLVRQVMSDPGAFSSYKQAGFSMMLGEDWPLIPSESDPPEHAEFRRLLLPLFTPKKMAELEGQIEQAARVLVHKLADRGHCDLVAEYSSQLPPMVFLGLMGLSVDGMGEFMPWVSELLHTREPATRLRAGQNIKQFLVDQIADRRRAPRDDFISYCAHARFKDRLLEEWEIISVVYQLYLGGLDTVAMSLGWYFKHLAENAANQQRLRDDPSLLPDALEELLRAYPIVTTSRVATRDVEVGGAAIKAGDYVMCSTPLVSRDASEYDRPDEVDFDRQNLIHMTFAYGPHRCVGSHLARRELAIALKVFLEHVPSFHRVSNGPLPLHLGALIGLNELPLAWSVG